MVDDFKTLLALVLVFVPLSLLSIGGGASLLADMEHQSVSVHGWTTPSEFADLFAISRAAPGPGTMLSTLIGWKAAGWAGAITVCVARLWGRWRGSVWHSAVERGLAPVAAGLMLSGGIAVLRVSPGGPAVWVAAVIATVLLLHWPLLHPLLLFAVGGALFGLAGLSRLA